MSYGEYRVFLLSQVTYVNLNLLFIVLNLHLLMYLIIIQHFIESFMAVDIYDSSYIYVLVFAQVLHSSQ